VEKREDSQGGFRREFAEHRIEDAKAFGNVEKLISDSAAALEKKLAATTARIGALRWLVVTAIGIATTGIGWILVKLYEIAARH